MTWQFIEFIHFLLLDFSQIQLLDFCELKNELIFLHTKYNCHSIQLIYLANISLNVF